MNPRESQPDPYVDAQSDWDNLKRDRFELLSAYLDGEVTPAERQQVLLWLEQDQTMQCLYARLLKLRRGLQCMPVPPSDQSVEETLAKVQARIRRGPRRTAAAWGGMAIAALFVSAVMGSLTVPGAINWFGTSDESAADGSLDKALDSTPLPAEDTVVPESVSSEALMITIDNPVVPIPMAVEPSDGVESADATTDPLAGETPWEADPAEADSAGMDASGTGVPEMGTPDGTL